MQPWWLFFLYVCVYIYIYLYIFSGHVHVYAWDREGNADEGRGQVFRSIEQKEVSAVLVSQFINGPFNVANFNSVCVPLSDYPLCHPISYPPEANTLTLHRRDSVFMCMCVFGEEGERESVGKESVWQLWQRVTETEMFYYKLHRSAPISVVGKHIWELLFLSLLAN